jgi:hypothetical protein
MSGARREEAGMIQVDYFVLADAVAAVGGKHYIHGAGWDTLTSSGFPTVHPAMGAAVRLRIPWHDTNLPVEIELDVLDADGRSILPNPPGVPRGTLNVGRPPELPMGDDQVLQLSFPLTNLRFASAGRYVVSFRLAGEVVARAPFRVVLNPKAAAARKPAEEEEEE